VAVPGSKRLAWTVLSGLSAVAAGALARRLVKLSWRALTGRELPPEDDSRSTSLGEAVAWAAGVGAAAGVARVMSRQAAATVWKKSVGEPPPGDEKQV
jgi:Protein of unknown function (DUF4235)